MSTPAPRLVSEAEYLRREEQSPEKHEYLGGVLYAQAGASGPHVRIVGNIGYALMPTVRRAGCRLYQSDMKLRIERGSVYYYPDVMVVCGRPPPHSHYETAPSLLIEVQSESTRLIDEREKLIAYTGIPSVQAYLIAAQDERRVTIHQRRADSWTASEVLGAGEVALPGLVASISLDDIYFGVLEAGAQPASGETG